MKRIITIAAAAAVMLSFGSVTVFAAETDVNDGLVIRLEENNTFADPPGVITAIEAPDKTEYSFEYKPVLDELFLVLPDTLTVRIGDRTEKMGAVWVCEEDYNNILDEYTFVPDMEGFTLSGDVKLPRLTVTVKKQLPDAVSGYVPMMTKGSEIPFVTEEDNALGAVKLPAKYNVYDRGELPKVRDQLSTQSCWAHAAIGAIETDLIHDKKAKTNIDLSEMHLSYYFRHSADPKGLRKDIVEQTGPGNYLSEGAFPSLAACVLSNLIGAIPEKLAPLDEDPAAYAPGIEDAVSKDTVQLRNAYMINGKDKTGIKKAVMEHGGVSMGFCAAVGKEDVEKYYNAQNGAFYCYDANTPNHAVMIVGWDDNYSRKKFNKEPEGNGAWLIRNSWGKQGYGYEGYFWLSYYDKTFPNEEPAIAIDADTDVFDNCYSYDGIPFYGDYHKLGAKDTLSVTYDVAAHEAVKGVGFETGSANANMNVCAKNLSTGQSVSATVRIDAAGIYTAVFDKPLEVYDKSTVRVSISGVSDDGKKIKVGYEYTEEPIVYGSFTFKAVVDRGYIKNGKKYKDYDLHVKLYTDRSNAPYKKVTGVKLSKDKATVYTGETLKLKAAVRPAKATIKDVTWKSSNEKVATVSKNGKVKGIKEGKATITVTTKDGKKTAKCKVKVKKKQ